jgi:hypothetical protein
MDRQGETSVLRQALGFFLLYLALHRTPAYIAWSSNNDLNIPEMIATNMVIYLSQLLSSVRRRGLGWASLGLGCH